MIIVSDNNIISTECPGFLALLSKHDSNYDCICIRKDELCNYSDEEYIEIIHSSHKDIKTIQNIKFINLHQLIRRISNDDLRLKTIIHFQKYNIQILTQYVLNNNNSLIFNMKIIRLKLNITDFKEILKKRIELIPKVISFLNRNLDKIEEYLTLFSMNISYTIQPNIILYRNFNSVKKFMEENKIEDMKNIIKQKMITQDLISEVSSLIEFIPNKQIRYDYLSFVKRYNIVTGRLGGVEFYNYYNKNLSLPLSYLISIGKLEDFLTKLRQFKLMNV